MGKYVVHISEELGRDVEVEADDEKDALDKVMKDYDDQKIILTADDFVGNDFEIKQNKKKKE